MFVGLSAHSFATIANFQWFSKLPSPLNGMVEGNHWDQWFSDGFGIRQPLHNKLRGVIGKKKFVFLIGWRLLIFGRILMKFFVLV